MPRPARSYTHRQPAAAASSPPAIVFSVHLTDGTFDSQVSVPVAAPAAEREEAVRRWHEIMLFGLKLPGSVEIENTVPVKT